MLFNRARLFYLPTVNNFFFYCKTLVPIFDITYDFLVSLLHVVTYVKCLCFLLFAAVNFFLPYYETIKPGFTTLCKDVASIKALLTVHQLSSKL